MSPNGRAPRRAGGLPGRDIAASDKDNLNHSAASRKALALCLRTAADILEAETAAPAASAGARYYKRSTAPIEARAWDRAVKEIPTYRPGRELLVRVDDLHAWIESQPVEREPIAIPVDENAPLDFAEFKRSARRTRVSK